MEEYLKAIRQQEAEVERMVKEFCKGLSDSVGKTDTGFHLTNNHPACGTISLSTILDNSNRSLSADYWMPDAQANAVNGALFRSKRATDVVDRVEKMLDTKKAGDTPLNQQTLEVLKGVMEE